MNKENKMNNLYGDSIFESIKNIDILYEELIDLQYLIKKESSLKELCKYLIFIY